MKNADLQKVLEFCEEKNLYFGEGNPNAKILFVGQEIGYGSENSEDKQPSFFKIKENSEKETNKNLCFWERRTSEDLEKYLLHLQGHFKDVSPNPTWKSYQKIVNVILGRSIEDKCHDFLNYSFITEYSQLSLPKNQYRPKDMDKKEFDEKKKKSIDERKTLFKQDFFQNFPTVIMACGHYPTRQYPMNMPQTFGVKWAEEESKKISKELSTGYCNLHFEENKILIHTRQLSNFRDNKENVNQLLTKIAKLCKPIYDKHIELEKILNVAEQRWNNGGKEIYEAMQNNPEFVDSLEYKKYMADLKKEDL